MLGDKALKTLRLSQEARVALLDDLRRLPRSTDPTYRSWERWLKGGSPTLPVTFEQEAAVEHANATLLSLSHPLLRQAASYLRESETVVVRLAASHDSAPVGVHPFAIYHWTKQGAKRDEELVPVAGASALADVLLEVLPQAVDAGGLELPSQQAWDDLDAVHHQLRRAIVSNEHDGVA